MTSAVASVEGSQGGVGDSAQSEAQSLERPDPQSAQFTAQLTGQRIEDLSRRDAYTQVFANPDGTWTSESSTEPVRVQDDNGVWRSIDTSLEAANGVITPLASAADVSFSAGGDRTFATIVEEGKTLEWRWPSVLPTPTVEGSTVTYVDAVAGGGDLVVTANATGFTHNIVLHEPPRSPIEFRMPVVVDGAKLTETASGGFEIETTAGSTLVDAAAPLMWDASTNSVGEPKHVELVDASVTQTAAGTPRLTLTPDPQYLADEKTVYPVTVDPSFTTFTTGDTWLQNADYTSSQSASDMLRAGTYDGGGHVARSFLKFGDGNDDWAGKRIVSADLVLRNWYSGSCTGAAIRVSRILDPWSVTGIQWPGPTTGSGQAADFAPAYGYTSACGGADATWDLTGMVQDWADGSFTNYGIRLKAVDEQSIYTWRKYRSSEYGGSVRPKLSVTYDSYPNNATALGASPGNPGYVTTTTPTLSATVTDPDGENLKAHFSLLNSNGVEIWNDTTGTNQPCGTGQGGCVSSGSVATMSVPAGVMTNGLRYGLRAKAVDTGSGPNGLTLESKQWSATSYITVDSSQPLLPTIGSAEYVDGGVYEVPKAGSTFHLKSSVDVTGFDVKLDGVASAPPNLTAPGDALLAWSPAAGSHLLEVSARDAAGNTSGTADLQFTIGSNFLITTIPAQSCGDGCTLIQSTTILDGSQAGPLAANSSVQVPTGVPEIQPDDTVDKLLLSVTASQWTSVGGLRIENPDFQGDQPATLTFGSADSPSAGVTVTAEVPVSASGQLRIENLSPGNVTVKVSVYGWRTWYDDEEEFLDAPWGEVMDPGTENLADSGTTMADEETLSAAELSDAGLAQSAPSTSESTCSPYQTESSGELARFMCVEESNELQRQTDLQQAAASGHPYEVAPAEAQAAGVVTGTCDYNKPTSRWIVESRWRVCRVHQKKVEFWVYNLTTKTTYLEGESHVWVRQKWDVRYHNLTFYYYWNFKWLDGWGEGSDYTVYSKALCVDATCSDPNYTDYVNDNLKPGITLPWHSFEAYGYPGDADYVKLVLEWFTADAMGASTLMRHTPPHARCDGESYISGQGCVFPQYTPTAYMLRDGAAPETANHIYEAQHDPVGAHWGLRGVGEPLQRKYWPTKENPNRIEARRMCRQLRALGGVGSCDEYPFASTYQGCALVTVPRCSVDLINLTDNRTGGSLLNTYYYHYRLIDSDKFWMEIL